MNLDTISDFGNLFFAGILAGIEIGIHYGVGAPPKVLRERADSTSPSNVSQIARSGASIFCADDTVGNSNYSAPWCLIRFWFRCAGLLAAVTWIILRVIGTVPINKDSHTWDVEAPPKDWRARVERAELFHIYGTWAAITIFAFFLIATAVETGALR